MRVVLLTILAYLLGSIPTSYLIGRLKGIDLREHGSGNLGGTNAFRVMGVIAAIPVIVVDVAKGFVPAYFFSAWDGASSSNLALVYGIAAISGHVFSVFMRFRGGKGVATGGGVIIALAPAAALVSLLVWIGVVAITGYVSVASLAAATLVPVTAWLTGEPRPISIFFMFVACFVWWTHRTNLRRLVSGRESRFGQHGTEGDRSPGGGS